MTAPQQTAAAKAGALPGDAPDLSVVIVSWNDWPKLQRCIASIHGSDGPPSEILVIDNASSDGTPEHLRRRFPDVRITRNARNIGHTKAVNLGFAQAQGELVLLLDSDTELDEVCIVRLREFLCGRPDVDVVAPRTFNTDGTVQETARNFPSALSGLFGRQSTLTRWFPRNPVSRRYLAQDRLHATEPFPVQQISGACMLFRRRLLAEVGAWDERYFGYWVDTDWCHSLQAAGRRIFCVPDARIVHHESNARGKRKSPRRIWMFHYGAYQLYTRWHTFGAGDPRSVLAGVALLARAALLIARNVLLPRRTAATTLAAESGVPGVAYGGEERLQ